MTPNSPGSFDAPLDGAFKDRILRAITLLSELAAALGPGRHSITCSAIRVGEGFSLSSELLVGTTGVDNPEVVPPLALALSEGLQPDWSSGLVVRSHHHEGGHDLLRGWVTVDDGLRPLTASEIELAHTTDPLTGQHLPPEPGTVFGDAFPLGDPEGPDDGGDERGTALHDV
ncbi:hypothetical protein [Streptomyces sp. NRRL F-5123]|uniref:hypothetical protein n=1 Tax=Streptomyces sp. NRRL F-5123 TaxID=1463856 RepID=UPI0004E1F4A7|nr:hypothetical protein [Streptomyces sp. NRRL F-5123]